MNRKGRYILVLVTAIGCSLLLTFKQSEPLWIGFCEQSVFCRLSYFLFWHNRLIASKRSLSSDNYEL